MAQRQTIQPDILSGLEDDPGVPKLYLVSEGYDSDIATVLSTLFAVNGSLSIQTVYDLCRQGFDYGDIAQVITSLQQEGAIYSEQDRWVAVRPSDMTPSDLLSGDETTAPQYPANDAEVDSDEAIFATKLRTLIELVTAKVEAEEAAASDTAVPEPEPESMKLGVLADAIFDGERLTLTNGARLNGKPAHIVALIIDKGPGGHLTMSELIYELFDDQDPAAYGKASNAVREAKAWLNLQGYDLCLEELPRPDAKSSSRVNIKAYVLRPYTPPPASVEQDLPESAIVPQVRERKEEWAEGPFSTPGALLRAVSAAYAEMDRQRSIYPNSATEAVLMGGAFSRAARGVAADVASAIAPKLEDIVVSRELSTLLSQGVIVTKPKPGKNAAPEQAIVQEQRDEPAAIDNGPSNDAEESDGDDPLNEAIVELVMQNMAEPKEAEVRTSQSGSTATAASTASAVAEQTAADGAESPDQQKPQLVGVGDFEEMFGRFQTPLINFIFRMVGNREQAYDLTQDVFTKAYRAMAGGTSVQAGALSSWLYRIAHNTATDALRRRRLINWLPLSLFNEDRGVGAGMPGAENLDGSRQGSEDDALVGDVFGGGYDGGRFEQHVADREVVHTVLKRMPPKYAACLLLYEHEGLSCSEIAELLSLSPSAVKMRLMRARERFIQIYKQETGRQ